MREIKFRAWDRKNKLMYSHSETNIDFFNNNKVWGIDLDTGFAVLIDAELMQCTGLKDKNDKEIYEGDIVRCRLNGLEKYQKGNVEFEDGAFIFNWGFIGKTYLGEIEDIEVIGNQYQYPEKLKD